MNCHNCFSCKHWNPYAGRRQIIGNDTWEFCEFLKAWRTKPDDTCECWNRASAMKGKGCRKMIKGKCMLCGEPSERGRTHDGCIRDMIYNAYENGSEITPAMKSLCSKRRISIRQIHKEYKEDKAAERICYDTAV